MKKTFWLFFFFLAVIIIPALCQATTTILTNVSPNHTITSGSDEQVYGTSASNQIILESGARAELINFPGQNSIQIQSSSDIFTVSRSGTIVTFEGSDGTVLKIPATTSVQTVSFSDRAPLTLSIYQGQVILDDQVVTTAAVAIDGSSEDLIVGTWGVEAGVNYIYFDIDKDGRIFNISAKLPVTNTLYPFDDSNVTLDNFKCTIINSDTFTFSVSKSESYGNGYAEKSISLNGTLVNDNGDIWAKVDWSAQDAIATAFSYKGSDTAYLQKIDAEIEPGPEEICDNGIDDDCDGYIDEHCPPKDVSATDGIYSDKVRITWTASTTATSYEIWRSTDSNSSSATKLGTATETYYEDYDGETEQIYYYWVKATSNDVDFGSFSAGDTGYKIDPPSAPTNVSASDGVSSLYIEITWNASDRAEHYEVWQSKTDDTSSAKFITTTSDTSFKHYNNFDFGGGTIYYYWIKAENSAGTSDFSNVDFGYVKKYGNPITLYLLGKKGIVLKKSAMADEIVEAR